MKSSMSAELRNTYFLKSTWVLYHWTSGLPIFHLRIHATFGCEISKCKKTQFSLWIDRLFGSSFPCLAQQLAILIPYFPHTNKITPKKTSGLFRGKKMDMFQSHPGKFTVADNGTWTWNENTFPIQIQNFSASLFPWKGFLSALSQICFSMGI